MRDIAPQSLPKIMVVVLGALLALLLLGLPAAAWYQQDMADAPLQGQFSVVIGQDEIPPELEGSAALIGQWSLTFGEDGAFSLSRQDVGQVVTGSFEAGPATLTFTDWRGVVGCEVSEDGAATYAWRQADDVLTLTALDDTCGERLALLTTHPLGSVDACETAAPASSDPFATDAAGTPAAGAPVASGVAAQEGFGQAEDLEAAIDVLLRSAGGCWATADPDRFMMLHSQGLRGQIAMMGSPEAFNQELREVMRTPLRFERIGEVNVVDPTHAWAYVEINLDGAPTPQQVNFVLENGVWRFDSFALFGPPIAGEAPGSLP